MKSTPCFFPRKLNLSRRLLVLSSTIAASLLLSGSAAFAGTLAVNAGSLTVTPTNATASTIFTAFSVSPFTFNGSTAVKLSGDQLFTLSPGNGSVVISFSGTGSANQFDKFSLGYKFSLTLAGTATATPTLNVSGTDSLPNPPFNNTFSAAVPLSTAAANTTTNYGPTGVDVTTALPLAVTATYNANATINFTGATAGSTLRITIPVNSIDFALAPTTIPEPTALGLLLLGAPLIAARRRRTAI